MCFVVLLCSFALIPDIMCLLDESIWLTWKYFNECSENVDCNAIQQPPCLFIYLPSHIINKSRSIFSNFVSVWMYVIISSTVRYETFVVRCCGRTKTVVAQCVCLCVCVCVCKAWKLQGDSTVWHQCMWDRSLSKQKLACWMLIPLFVRRSGPKRERGWESIVHQGQPST